LERRSHQFRKEAPKPRLTVKKKLRSKNDVASGSPFCRKKKSEEMASKKESREEGRRETGRREG